MFKTNLPVSTPLAKYSNLSHNNILHKLHYFYDFYFLGVPKHRLYYSSINLGIHWYFITIRILYLRDAAINITL